MIIGVPTIIIPLEAYRSDYHRMQTQKSLQLLITNDSKAAKFWGTTYSKAVVCYRSHKY